MTKKKKRISQTVEVEECYSCKKPTRGRLSGIPLCHKCLRKAHGGGRGCGCEGCITDCDAEKR